MQLEVATLTMGLNRIRSEWTAICYEIAFRRLMLALKDGFNPEQPPDEQGRWTDGGGDRSVGVAARGREAECEANMQGIRSSAMRCVDELLGARGRTLCSLSPWAFNPDVEVLKWRT